MEKLRHTTDFVPCGHICVIYFVICIYHVCYSFTILLGCTVNANLCIWIIINGALQFFRLRFFIKNDHIDASDNDACYFNFNILYLY